MEYLDIYNKNGKATGKKASYKEVHEKGSWHHAVHVWVVNHEGDILLQLRAHNLENHPDMWDVSAAGHVPSGESDLDAALRETQEELGIAFGETDIAHIGTVQQESTENGYVNKEINPVYIAVTDMHAEEMKLQPEEVAEVKFVTFDELKTMIETHDPGLVPHPEEFKLLLERLEEYR